MWQSSILEQKYASLEYSSAVLLKVKALRGQRRGYRVHAAVSSAVRGKMET